jgi:2-keto-4-pentenoate hydratase
LPARDEAWSVDEVLDAVATVHPSIEIVNPRLPKGFNDVVEWYVADGGLSHALVLGPGVKPLKRTDYAGITNKVSLNGVSKYSGIASNALGGPELALTWLANNLTAKGLFLRAGDVVTTGVITEVFNTSIGDHVEATTISSEKFQSSCRKRLRLLFLPLGGAGDGEGWKKAALSAK